MLSISLLFSCVACSSKEAASDSGEKYALSMTYSLSGDAEQTEIAFDAIISGTKSDIESIDAYAVVINEEYHELLLENGPYSSQYTDDYFQISGTIIFDTIGMTKEDVDAIHFIQAIAIIDKDKNTVELEVPQDRKGIE